MADLGVRDTLRRDKAKLKILGVHTHMGYTRLYIHRE